MLALDDAIIAKLFPEAGALTLGENFGTFAVSEGASRCSVGIESEEPLRPGFPTNILLRLEDSSTSLAAAVGMAQVAHSVLPDLVPPFLDLGAVTTSTGRAVEYSIRELFINADGVFTLEEVSPLLSTSAKTAIVDQVVTAMEHLQTQAPSTAVSTIAKLSSARDPSTVAAHDANNISATSGGPSIGFATTAEELLTLLFKPPQHSHQPPCTLTPLPCGTIRVASAHASDASSTEDVTVVDFTPSDLAALHHSTVLCHNNLEPRNILVKHLPGSSATAPKVTLAGIIGWERASFQPFAVEFGSKDAALGKHNFDFEWYALFKARSARLLPSGPETEKLLEAMWLYDVACDLLEPGVRSCLQRQWMEFYGIEQAEDVRVGWERGADQQGALPVMVAEEWEIMQEAVLEEVGLLDEEVLDEIERVVRAADRAGM